MGVNFGFKSSSFFIIVWQSTFNVKNHLNLSDLLISKLSLTFCVNFNYWNIPSWLVSQKFHPRGHAKRFFISVITFELSKTALAIFRTLFDEVMAPWIVVMTAFGNFGIAKHLFQFLEVCIFPRVGSTHKASMSLTWKLKKKNRILGWFKKETSGWVNVRTKTPQTFWTFKMPL